MYTSISICAEMNLMLTPFAIAFFILCFANKDRSDRSVREPEFKSEKSSKPHGVKRSLLELSTGYLPPRKLTNVDPEKEAF